MDTVNPLLATVTILTMTALPRTSSDPGAGAPAANARADPGAGAPAANARADPGAGALAGKPLRKDAERNRRRILDAARELFAERGLGVTLNDIAHHAGVGVGTVYRRFPDKTKLVDDLFEQRYAQMGALMDRAVADPDPWRGVVAFLEGALELQSRDRALHELVCAMPDGLDRVRRMRDELLPRGAELVRRAREAGDLYPDIEATDMAVFQLMVGAVIDAAGEVEPGLWRRYLGI